jgi:DDE superfamily endonuclease
VNGPFKAGVHDVTILLDHGLADALEDWECVETDGGYSYKFDVNDPERNAKASDIVTKPMSHSRAESWDKAKKRACHETVNGRLKDWNVLDSRFRSDKSKHGICFFAVCVLVQLGMKERPNWQSNYDVVYPYLPKPQPHYHDDDDDTDDDEDSKRPNTGNSIELDVAFQNMQLRALNGSDSDDEESFEGSV